jgi:hypothetical protein
MAAVILAFVPFMLGSIEHCRTATSCDPFPLDKRRLLPD